MSTAVQPWHRSASGISGSSEDPVNMLDNVVSTNEKPRTNCSTGHAGREDDQLFHDLEPG